MRRHVQVTVAFLSCLLACGPGPGGDPRTRSSSRPQLPLDPVLGPMLLESSQLRATRVSLSMMGPRAHVFVFEGRGWDAELNESLESTSFFVVDPATGVGQAAPPPPLPPSERHSFLAHADPSAAGVALVVGRTNADRLDVARFDGASWTTQPGPYSVGFDDFVVGSWRGDSVILLTQTEAWFGFGGRWRKVRLPASPSSTLGPWDAAGAAFVYVEGGRVCSLLYPEAALASGTVPPGPPSCVALSGGELAGTARNGTTADFQALVDVKKGEFRRVVRFTGGEASFGPLIQATRLVATPGSAQPLVTVGPSDGMTPAGPFIPTLRTVREKALGPRVFDAQFVGTGCACDLATDPTCGCLARKVLFASWAPDAAGARLGVLSIDDVEGRRRLHVRVVELPAATAAFPATACTLPCEAPQVCVFASGLAAQECVAPQAPPPVTSARSSIVAADPVIAPAVEVTLSSADPRCTSTPEGAGAQAWTLDEFCSYSLEASAPGHVPLRLEGLTTMAAGEQLSFGSFTLARGGLVDATPAPLSSPGTDQPSIRVAPGGGAMVARIGSVWRWLERAPAAPGFTTAVLGASSGLSTSYRGARFVTPTRALLPAEDESLLLAEAGAVVNRLSGWFDLSGLAVAANAARAVVPSGSRVSPNLWSEASLVAFDGAGLSVVATDRMNGRGHAIRPDGSQAGYFNSGGQLRLFSASGVEVVSPMWPNTSKLRVALGPGSEYLVIAPPVETSSSTPCNTLQLCRLFAFEDAPRETPQDPLVRQLVQLSSRALWGEMSATTSNFAWLERDTAGLVHLFHRVAATTTTTELPLGGSLTDDFGHVVSGDHLVVLVPTGALVVNLATGSSRLEAGTFSRGLSTDAEPRAQVDHAGRIWVQPADGSWWWYAPTTGAFTRLGQDFARFGVDNDRALTQGVTLFTPQGTPSRTYQFGAPTTNVDPLYRTWRARGAPCLLYWRMDDVLQGTSTTRRWYCTD